MDKLVGAAASLPFDQVRSTEPHMGSLAWSRGEPAIIFGSEAAGGNQED